jgi:thiamine-phosphate pyrophosphorylase
LGVGPVFTSETKAFHDLPGLALVETAAALTNLPWFAIGGINEASLDRVFEAGATRIAVFSAIVRADRPRAAARALRQRLDAHAESSTSPAGNPLG